MIVCVEVGERVELNGGVDDEDEEAEEVGMVRGE